MSEAKHTPGPWELGDYVHVDEEGKGAGRFLRDEDDEAVAYIDCHNEMDAHLISAAPDLLAVAKRIDLCGFLGDDWETTQRMRAAIAKAEGVEASE